MTIPIADEIIRLPSHAERADWLIRCPDIVIGGYVASIRVGLEKAGFPEGIDFLAQRLEDGSLPQTRLVAVNYTRSVMVDAAKKRDGGAG